MPKSNKKDFKTDLRDKAGAKLVAIDCPPDIFDDAPAYVLRRRRISVRAVDLIGLCKTSDEVYEILAGLIPQWHGVVSVETGEKLANPEDDSSVFSHLGIGEQLPWLREVLKVKPSDLGKSMNAPT